MNNVMRAGNVGVVSTSAHPNGLRYCIVKRDIPGGCFLVYERNRRGLTRLIKMYPGHSDAAKLVPMLRDEEAAAGRPTDFLVQPIDKPLSTPSVTCCADGTLEIDLTPGGSDGLCDWVIDEIPNACAPFTYDGEWPITVSATDDQARRGIDAALSQIESLKRDINNGKDIANDALKRVKNLEKAGAGLNKDAVLQLVSDDLANDNGRLRHALWPRVLKMVGDALYLQLKDAASPLINVIRQGGKVIQ